MVRSNSSEIWDGGGMKSHAWGCGDPAYFGARAPDKHVMRVDVEACLNIVWRKVNKMKITFIRKFNSKVGN